MYGAIAVLQPGAFFSQGTDGSSALHLYFSFVTSTTVGYGDLSAATGRGHTLAVTEALVGQLYLVAVVALLAVACAPVQRWTDATRQVGLCLANHPLRMRTSRRQWLMIACETDN